MHIRSVLETCIYVDDLVAAERFYGSILGLKLYSKEDKKFAFFQLDQGMLLIFNPEASLSSAHDLPDHGARGIGHVAFCVEEAELEDWRGYLPARGVTIEQDHIWPHGRRSLYFRDPHGHSIELAGAALWTNADE